MDEEALFCCKSAPDGALYYGAKVRLRLALTEEATETLPAQLRAAPLLLASAPLTSGLFAAKSKRQLVYLTQSDDGTEWRVLPGEGSPFEAQRLEGTAVRYGDAVSLQHAPTARLLSDESPCGA